MAESPAAGKDKKVPVFVKTTSPPPRAAAALRPSITTPQHTASVNAAAKSRAAVNPQGVIGAKNNVHPRRPQISSRLVHVCNASRAIKK